ncbi:MAG: hypothetical protein ACKVG0_15275, partial [Alphaproteobacteria bacterium]
YGNPYRFRTVLFNTLRQKQTRSTAFNEVRYILNNGRSENLGLSARIDEVSALASPNAVFHSANMSRKWFQLFPVGPTKNFKDCNLYHGLKSNFPLQQRGRPYMRAPLR